MRENQPKSPTVDTYQHQMRAELVREIIRIWPVRFVHLAPDYESLKKKNAFYEELAVVVNLLAIENNQRESMRIKMSKDTLRRMLNPLYTKSFYTITCNSIALFLGYKSWGDYKRSKLSS
jgi:hypothetical protein